MKQEIKITDFLRTGKFGSVEFNVVDYWGRKAIKTIGNVIIDFYDLVLCPTAKPNSIAITWRVFY